MRSENFADLFLELRQHLRRDIGSGLPARFCEKFSQSAALVNRESGDNASLIRQGLQSTLFSQRQCQELPPCFAKVYCVSSSQATAPRSNAGREKIWESPARLGVTLCS